MCVILLFSGRFHCSLCVRCVFIFSAIQPLWLSINTHMFRILIQHELETRSIKYCVPKLRPQSAVPSMHRSTMIFNIDLLTENLKCLSLSQNSPLL